MCSFKDICFQAWLITWKYRFLGLRCFSSCIWSYFLSCHLTLVMLLRAPTSLCTQCLVWGIFCNVFLFLLCFGMNTFTPLYWRLVCGRQLANNSTWSCSFLCLHNAESQESTTISWWQTRWSVAKWRYTDNACANMCHACPSLHEHIYKSVSHNELILVITSHISAAVAPHEHHLGTSQWSWLGYVLCNVDTETTSASAAFLRHPCH